MQRNPSSLRLNRGQNRGRAGRATRVDTQPAIATPITGSSVCVEHVAVGCICNLPNQSQVFEPVYCVRSHNCQQPSLPSEGFRHPVVISELYQREDGDIMAKFQLVSTWRGGYPHSVSQRRQGERDHRLWQDIVIMDGDDDCVEEAEHPRESLQEWKVCFGLKFFYYLSRYVTAGPGERVNRDEVGVEDFGCLRGSDILQQAKKQKEERWPDGSHLTVVTST
ncbi:uncharacterized protein LY89DRAFT_678627 [Mollisia scopiformis]|uniref:Uncharacterized protein n=1 Tax=Mollisia scopiformis TaxID=149040 RepID=A0A132B2J2_MOLSC|nr:uncharacterized protein LY89DRAFT_678627 [Mollisia scopiformis]KUJ06541.1 hypothetical protein LY89DRAFT_678627 [Mollisia scopiformis]